MRLFWLSASLIFILDRFSKYLILKAQFEKIEILPILNIVKVWNKGIAFGLFSKTGIFSTILLIFVTLVVLLIIYVWAKKIYFQNKKDKISLISLGMLLGGGLGNLIDRIFFGKVFDFIDLHIKNLHWPVFNVADIAVTLALFLLIYKALKIRNVLS
uniref:Lipoprotein signal peptidase n=1 Tax=Thermodesulfobacterium geofontis TaxID=1295609 RepID=A0A7V4JQ72_9BACT